MHIWSYAKINLYLDVLRRREDGYHNIETIFQTVSLHDELSFADDPSGRVTLTCSRPGLETGDTNLVRRAAALLRGHTGCARGAAIHLEKNIPVAAGLAGGSGNAAATLSGLNVLWKLGLSAAELGVLALQLGSDVPYCLRGGLMAGTLRGEETAPVEAPRSWWYVLAHPPIAVSTAAVYNHPLLEKNTEPLVDGRTASFRRAIGALAAGDMGTVVFNRMERPVFAMHPVLAEVKARLLGAGCLAAAMSGSGPTLFGVCAGPEEARHAGERLGASCPCTVVEGVSRGLSVLA
jgi:4-diphosphocytidyl-2-C-methyl-D-erythritol kinase